jgi:ubiquitin-protein ligase
LTSFSGVLIDFALDDNRVTDNSCPEITLAKLALNVESRMSEIRESRQTERRRSSERINLTSAAVSDQCDSTSNIDVEYNRTMSKYRIRSVDLLSKNSHHFFDVIVNDNLHNRKRTARLAQEMTDASRALPCASTHAMYVCVDKSRCHVLKVLMTGVQGTPYGLGCFEFDVYCPPEYPDVAPKVHLVTTGNASIRFNPNLYANGKVCLSLLGTWSGKGGETWTQSSTLLQVYSSIQSLVMSDDVYFNEPGYERALGTDDGMRLNQGYSNIVRYGTIAYAMLRQLEQPSACFAGAIRYNVDSLSLSLSFQVVEM